MQVILAGITAILVTLFTPLLQAQSVEEYTTQVQKMYISYYGRPGDPGGVDYWVGELENSGGELADIIDDFGTSEEYNSRFGSLSNEALVNNIFVQLLGRNADPEGLEFYSLRLDSQQFTLASIALNIADGIQTGTSDESTYSNKLAVAMALTQSISETGADYGANEIDAAVALLSAVDSSDDLDTALATVETLINDWLGIGVDQGPVDITNAIFAETSGDCAVYAQLYEAFVLDQQRSVAFESGVEITAGNSSCEITSNSIPNHDFNDASAHFATNTAEVNQSFSIPLQPVLAANTTALGQSYYNAIMLNGVPLDLISAGCYRPTDPMADQDGNVAIGCQLGVDNWILDPLGTASRFGADAHNAHTQPNGLYHYHGNPVAMFDDNPGPNGSPVIGFAADGFPVYGSYFNNSSSGEVRKALSGYTLKSGSRPNGNDSPGGSYDGQYIDDWEYTATGDLDACNGMTVGGQYGYYVTDTYPWVMGCLSGTKDSSFDKGGPP